MNIHLIRSVVFFLCMIVFCCNVQAQWPKIVTGKQGEKITIYQFQPENVNGNKVSGRCPLSIKYTASDDYIFGIFWFDATVSTNSKTKVTTLVSLVVTDIRMPDVTDTNKIVQIKSTLETEIPKLKISGSMDDIYAALKEEQSNNNSNFKNEAPVIYYRNESTILVIIDGEPKIEEDKELKVKRVINSPFLLVQDPGNSKFYLYAGTSWYVSPDVKSGYEAATKLPSDISALDKKLKSEGQLAVPSKEEIGDDEKTSVILISTVPAELLQTKGEAQLANIAGTELLYVTNSDEDIFKNVSDQNYYVLLSGRWYSSPKLDGTWTFVPSDKLPGDFKKIPAGSDKDNVLASVAGTYQSEDAVKEAQVPQTAKVNRDSATCTVSYDGEPVFEKIEGTSLELAKNTGSTVIKSAESYYALENGIWFISSNAKGPWKVSDDRPKDLDKIPASSPAYNAQNVYIYESTPQVVYVGYTPAYMGCYVYGGVVVYGTGYYYNPWYGPYYYPMPMTYGCSMHYNPYMGWSMSFHSYYGFYGYHGYHGHYHYHPYYHHHHHGGMYGPHGPNHVNHGNAGRANNIYNNRNGVKTNDVKRGDYSRPSTMDQGRQGTRAGAGQSGAPVRTDQRMQNGGAGAGAGNNNRDMNNGAGGGAAGNRQPAAGNRAGAGTGTGGGNMGGGDGGFGGRGGFGGGGYGGGGYGGGMGGGGGRMGGGGRR